MQSLGLSLMSLGILQYGVIPLFADFNRTHATNPRWPAHARFHVVTQVLGTSAIAVVSLWLLWSPRIDRALGICLAAILSFCMIGAFFASAAFRKRYGGALRDPADSSSKAATSTPRIDRNALNFGIAALLLVAGRLVLL